MKGAVKCIMYMKKCILQAVAKKARERRGKSLCRVWHQMRSAAVHEAFWAFRTEPEKWFEKFTGNIKAGNGRGI